MINSIRLRIITNWTFDFILLLNSLDIAFKQFDQLGQVPSLASPARFAHSQDLIE